MDVYFSFEPKRAIQAAAVILRAASGQRMSYLRLLKLLYLAEREQFSKAGRPILGGRVVAMEYGPLHRGVYDLIKGRHAAERELSEFFRRDRYELALVNDPGVLELSRSEIDSLNDVADRYCNHTE